MILICSWHTVPVRVKRVHFWNEICPLSTALAVIWCDWKEFRGKGNIWEPNRDRVELIFLNHWVSGSETSLDIQRANKSTVCFSELSRNHSWLPNTAVKIMIGSATRVYWQSECRYRSEPLRELHTQLRPSDAESRHLETEAVFKLHYQCSLYN